MPAHPLSYQPAPCLVEGLGFGLGLGNLGLGNLGQKDLDEL